MASSNAWVLPLDETLSAAVGEFEIIHLLHFPALFSAPGTPYYCNQVLVWQDQILPTLDLSAWLRGHALPRTQTLVAIATYPAPNNSTPNSVSNDPTAASESEDKCYAGLLLADIPRQILVDDSDACELPSTPLGWRQLAISCFRHNERAVPIIDLQTVFSGTLLHANTAQLA